MYFQTDEDLFPTNSIDGQSNNSLQSSLLVDHSNSQLNGESNNELGLEVASEGINTIINDPLVNEQVTTFLHLHLLV